MRSPRLSGESLDVTVVDKTVLREVKTEEESAHAPVVQTGESTHIGLRGSSSTMDAFGLTQGGDLEVRR